MFRTKYTDYDTIDDANTALLRGHADWICDEFWRTDTPDWWRQDAYQWLSDTFQGPPPRYMYNCYESWIEDWLRAFRKDMRRLAYMRKAAFWPTNRVYPSYMLLWRHQATRKLINKIFKGYIDTDLKKFRRTYNGCYSKFSEDLNHTYTFPREGKEGRPLIDGVVVRNRPWLPLTMHPDNQEAREYEIECAKLQVSKAGRKARRLLLENLTDAQQNDYFRKGYFYTAPEKQDLENRVLYALIRGLPNGNIYQIPQGKRPNIHSFCYHPEKPFPIDDILLTQKLVIEHDEEELLKNGNRSITTRELDNDPPVDWALSTSLWRQMDVPGPNTQAGATLEAWRHP